MITQIKDQITQIEFSGEKICVIFFKICVINTNGFYLDSNVIAALIDIVSAQGRRFARV